ncbi:MAG: hypothetical protein LLG06_12885 [Desulfobacteraceae bacterium]|nr:hypothetical protein [Desulfobacteraceae bacterium]
MDMKHGNETQDLTAQKCDELLSRFTLPLSSMELLQTGIELFETAYIGGNPDRVLKRLSEDKANSPRLEFLDKIWDNLAFSSRSTSTVSLRPPTLYDTAEYVELLRNAFPRLFPDGAGANPCVMEKDIYFLSNISEDSLSCLDAQHPLFPGRKREESKLMRYSLAVVELRDSFREFSEYDGSEDDEGIATLQSIVTWHQIVMSLSGAYERHCIKCARSSGCDVKDVISGAGCRTAPYRLTPDHPGKEKALLTRTFISHCRAQLERIYGTIGEFNAALKHSSSSIDIRIDDVLKEADCLRDLLKTEAGSGLWAWWRAALSPGLEDLTRFFDGVRRALRTTESALASADSDCLRRMSENILKSLNLEQIYDLRHPEFLKFLRDHATEDGSHCSSLAKIRKSIGRLVKDPVKPEALPAPDSCGSAEDEATDTQTLGELYKDLYDRPDQFMNVPQQLKEKLFRQIVQALQNRLCMGSAADLLDAYWGRHQSRWLRIPAAFLFPLMPRFSFRALQYVWMVLLTAFGLTVWFDAWTVFTMGLFLWLGLAMARLSSEARKETLDLREKGYEGYPKLIWNQLMPGFLVPMFLLLTPFALPGGMMHYVYEDIMDAGKLIACIAIFVAFSLLAIWKLQRTQEPFRNILVVFGFLWSQAFVLSFLAPLFFHRPGTGEISFALLGIPWSAALHTSRHQTYSVYPIASLAFSVLCLFAAVFLEGLYRKR